MGEEGQEEDDNVCMYVFLPYTTSGQTWKIEVVLEVFQRGLMQPARPGEGCVIQTAAATRRRRPNLSRRRGLVPPLPLRLPFAALPAVQPQR